MVDRRQGGEVNFCPLLGPHIVLTPLSGRVRIPVLGRYGNLQILCIRDSHSKTVWIYPPYALEQQLQTSAWTRRSHNREHANI